jgi:type IX secretion system PorP/SprF family membrane protein
MVMLKSLSARIRSFHSFILNYLYLSPSFAGLSVNNRIAFNYVQWPEIAHGYNTYSVAMINSLKNSGGLGVLIMQDQAGTGKLRSLTIGLQYSFDIKMTEKWHFRPGLHLMYTERAINFEGCFGTTRYRPAAIQPRPLKWFPWTISVTLTVPYRD